MTTQGYPTMDEVHAAGAMQLMRWSRHLPSPNDDNRETMEAILKRQEIMRTIDPTGYTRASKAVGLYG